MGSFFSKKEIPKLEFNSRSEAFTYMLAYMLEERGAEPMEAAQKANEFAELFAMNLGIPATVEPPVQGVEKYLQMAEKISDYCDRHPKAVEMVAGAATFLAGLVAGKQISEPTAPVPKIEPIDFNNID